MDHRLANTYARAYRAINYRLRTVAGGRWANYCRPTSIAILLTERCNARCVHCDIWKNRGQEDQPTVEQWKTVLHDLRRWLGPVHVVLTGGEALLMPFATDLVAYGSKVGLLIEHLTHGYWLDQSRIERLALANPWRVTISFDGIGEVHDTVRGRDHFFNAVVTSIGTLQRVRAEKRFNFSIRLKTVIMEHNLDGVCEVARFAKDSSLEVYYQPIVQNYNTVEDARWFEHSPTWPKDPRKAVAVVERLIAMKRDGYPIANEVHDLEVMIPYFEDPDAMRVATSAHVAHDKPLCAGLITLQIQSNGDVGICSHAGPIGNIKLAPIRQLWANRPRFWVSGCCMERRMSAVERRNLGLPALEKVTL
jgi:MoaA/NifB/PqqE/SkfB family radical SAM enzyme